MEIDFEDPIPKLTPQGFYLCEVAEVRVGTTKNGDERWNLRLVVAEGPHIGCQAVWDALVFSARGKPRARMVLTAMGLPATGKVVLTPPDLVHRRAKVEIRAVNYTTNEDELIVRNEVPYAGWSAP